MRWFPWLRRQSAGILMMAAGLIVAPAAAAQTPEPTETADAMMHALLTLEAQAIDIAYSPDLRDDDPAHRALLDGAVGSRVRIGTLNGHRALRIGEVAPDLAAAAADTADAGEEAADAGEERDAEEEAADAETDTDAAAELWLARDMQGWRLDVVGGGETADDVRTVPLSHHETAEAAPRLTASAAMTGADAGRLQLRWGRYAWSTDFRFDELPDPPRRPRVSGRGQEREAATDTRDFARGVTMAERNETALVLPDGARISILYWKSIDVEDEDYGRFEETADGDVVELIRAAPLRLRTDVGLRVGGADVPTGNLAPGYAGAYAIWIRRSGDGWRFVFNHEADSWGTQHDPAFDAAETAADYSRGEHSFRPLGATLVPTGPDGGRLVVYWGPHEWAADFTITR